MAYSIDAPEGEFLPPVRMEHSMTMIFRLSLSALALATAVPATAQQGLPPPPFDPEEAAAEAAATPPARAPTDSGIVVAPKQAPIPLEAFMVPKGCEDVAPGEVCITADPYEEPEETPAPEPGDRKLDAPAERRALANIGRDRSPTECGAPIGPATTACAAEQFQDYKEEKKLLDERYLPPEPE